MAIKTIYTNVNGINKLQGMIMQFVTTWVRVNKTPVPRKAIVEAMNDEGIKDYTTINAINSLLRKKYITRSSQSSNKTSYIQSRGL